MNTFLNTNQLTRAEIEKQLVFFKKNQDKLINEESMFNELFRSSNYESGQSYLKTMFNITDKRVLLNEFVKIEKDAAETLNSFNGKITIEIESQLSGNLMEIKQENISINDFEYLPFKCFYIPLNNFEEIESILVYKKTDTLYCHLQGIGKENVSLQTILSKGGLFPKHTFSSRFYDENIAPLSEETKELGGKYYKYVISLLRYMIDNNNDDIVIRDMGYDRLNNKLTEKQKSKSKYIKKLQSKSNTITLKFNADRVKYFNSLQRRRKNKKITQEINVKGYWKNVAVGKRGEGKTIKRWIEPFKKCVQNPSNNIDSIPNKIYQVS